MTQPSKPPAEVDDLVAYLDGELDHETSQRIEQHLARDSQYRLRLRQLQRAWDLLDSLPRVEASATFARTTVELVAVKAAEHVDQVAARSKQRKSLGWILGTTAVITTTIAGFLVAYAALNAPERQLLEDLPIIERLDQYRLLEEFHRGESVEFLRKLEQDGLFTREDSDAF